MLNHTDMHSSMALDKHCYPFVLLMILLCHVFLTTHIWNLEKALLFGGKFCSWHATLRRTVLYSPHFETTAVFRNRFVSMAVCSLVSIIDPQNLTGKSALTCWGAKFSSIEIKGLVLPGQTIHLSAVHGKNRGQRLNGIAMGVLWDMCMVTPYHHNWWHQVDCTIIPMWWRWWWWWWCWCCDGHSHGGFEGNG